MADPKDYQKLENVWRTKDQQVGSPELDALIRIAGMARTAFGDLAVTQSTPVYKGSAQYGLLNEVIPLSSLGGVATSVGSLFSCQSGTSQGGFGSISLNGSLAFRPGQGEKDLFTARFTTGQAGSEQFAGAINTNSGAGWGYNGTEFGILLRFGGAIEIQELTITTAATGSETATVTITGNDYPVNLTAGDVQHNASEVANSLSAQVPLWFFEQVDNQVIATSLIAAPMPGAFNFTSATAVASFDQITEGVLPIDSWYKQASWNGESMPKLNPSMLNNYKIQFGASVGYFSIFSATKNDYVLVHVINTNNSQTSLLIKNPTFGHTWYALNRAGTTNVSTEGSFAGLYREGKNTPTKATDSISATATNIDTTLTPLFSIRVGNVLNGVINEAKAIIKSIQIASDSGKPIEAVILKDAALVGSNWQYKDKGNSSIQVDTSAVSFTGGQSVSVTGFQTLIRDDVDAELLRDGVFTLAVRTTGGSPSDFSGVITYLEDL